MHHRAARSRGRHPREVKVTGEEADRGVAHRDDAIADRLGEPVEQLQRAPLGVGVDLDTVARLGQLDLVGVQGQAHRRHLGTLTAGPLRRGGHGNRRMGSAPAHILHRLGAEHGEEAQRAERREPPAEGLELVHEGFGEAAPAIAVVPALAHRTDAQEGHPARDPAQRAHRPPGHRRTRLRDGRNLLRLGGQGRRQRQGLRLGGIGVGGQPGGAQLVARDPRAHGIPRDAEPPRGDGDVPARLLERRQELVPGRVVRGERRGRSCRRPVGGRPAGAQLQHPGAHGGGIGQERDALHHVRELADIAGPGIGAQARARVGVQGLRRQPVLATGALEEGLRQHHDVAAALPEGRQHERHHRQTMIEVLAETPLAGGRLQVEIAGGDDAHVHRLAPGSAKPAHDALLEGGQQLGLSGLVQEPDLVEEEGAAAGDLEEPGLGPPRVRECARLEAEQLGLHEMLGQGGAVDGLERPGRPGARAVNGPREQTLAGAGLAHEQDGR